MPAAKPADCKSEQGVNLPSDPGARVGYTGVIEVAARQPQRTAACVNRRQRARPST
jgi:hypothetical protein